MTEKIVIRRTGKIVHTHQYFREQDKLKERITKNKDRFNQIQKCLDRIYNHPFKYKEIILLAKQLSETFNIKLDRAAKRYKEHLICWFCENWDTITNNINKIAMQRASSTPESFDDATQRNGEVETEFSTPEFYELDWFDSGLWTW